MRGLKKAAALLGSLLLTPGTEPARAQEVAASPPVSVRVQRETYQMGTRLRVQIVTPERDRGIRDIDEAFRVVEGVEGTLSDFRPEAELARVNAAEAREGVALSEELTRMLAEAFEWSDRTGGAFDPVVGSLIAAWDLRGVGRVPTPDELEHARESAGRSAVEFDARARTLVRKTPRVGLDAGGFGKGEALRAAAARLRALGVERGVIDFGGQVHVLGGGPDAARSTWETGVAHPFDRSRSVGTLALRDASASTSGPAERGRSVGGVAVSHHVDPRTGRPVEAWGSVTVVAEDPFVADVLSTALYVMGPEEGMIWAADLEEVGVVFLTSGAGDTVHARMNPGMSRWWLPEALEGTLGEK